MNILLCIVATVVTLVSLYLIVEGLIQGASNYYRLGGIILFVTIFAAVSYFLGWVIPIIVIFGLSGVAITLMGASGEQESDTLKIGGIFCSIGLLFCTIAFYYWYKSGWYLSMSIATCALSYICIMNALKCKRNYIPRYSASLTLLFTGITIYMCIVHEINIILILLVGVFVGIILKYIWTVVSDKLF